MSATTIAKNAVVEGTSIVEEIRQSSAEVGYDATRWKEESLIQQRL